VAQKSLDTRCSQAERHCQSHFCTSLYNMMFSQQLNARSVNGIFALLGCYAACISTYLPTFRDNVLAPSSRYKQSLPLNMKPIGCSETSVTTNLVSVISQKGEDIFMASPYQVVKRRKFNVSRTIWIISLMKTTEIVLEGADSAANLAGCWKKQSVRLNNKMCYFSTALLLFLLLLLLLLLFYYYYYYYLSHLCRIFTLTYLKQIMFLGNTVLQLSFSYYSWCL
jgi:hypothetical protein